MGRPQLHLLRESSWKGQISRSRSNRERLEGGLAMLHIYGDSMSGNCLKVKWTADYLGLDYRWIETGVLNGDTRTPAFSP